MPAVIGYSNQIDTATLSGWTNNSNLKNRYLSQKATASGALDIDLGSAQAIGLVALVSTSGVSSMTVTAGSSPGGSNLYSGTVSAYGGTDLMTTFANVTARYWRISASGSVGRIFLGPRFQPAAGIDWGATLGVESSTQVAQSLGGLEFFDERPTRRVWQGKYSWLGNAEAYEMLGVLRSHDVSKEVYVVEETLDTTYRAQRAFLGRFRTLNPIEWPWLENHACGIEIAEVI